MATLAANKNTSKKKSIGSSSVFIFGTKFPPKIVLYFGGNSYKGFSLGMHQSGQRPHFEERNSEFAIFRQ
jgi:hypothetical protein